MGCCKAGVGIIGEKLGRNGKQEMKGENNTPSQIPTQLLSLANQLGLQTNKADRMNYVCSKQPNLRHEAVAPSSQLTLGQL